MYYRLYLRSLRTTTVGMTRSYNKPLDRILLDGVVQVVLGVKVNKTILPIGDHAYHLGLIRANNKFKWLQRKTKKTSM